MYVGFLNGIPVDINIVRMERSLSHMLNPYLYTVEIRHGQYSWTIRRRYHHFWNLHKALVIHRAALHINRKLGRGVSTSSENHTPHAKTTEEKSVVNSNSTTKERIKDEEDGGGGGGGPNVLPRFPKRPDSMLGTDEGDREHRRHQLENYLQNILKCEAYRNHPDTVIKWAELFNQLFIFSYFSIIL